MGSVKAGLHDTAYEAGHVHGLYAPVGPSEPGGVENPIPQVTTNPTLEIRTRTRTGFTDDGAPVFEWQTLQASEAFLWEQRDEFDDTAGVTLVKAKAMFGNVAGISSLSETAVVVDPDTGVRWRVDGSEVLPTSIALDLERIEQSAGQGDPVVGPEPTMSQLAVLASEPFTMGWPGVLVVTTGASRLPVKGGTFRVDTVAAALGTAPLDGQVALDVNVNGLSIFPVGEAPVFASGVSDAVVGTHTETMVDDGDVITVDIDEVGATVPGSDLVVVVRLERVA